MSQTNDLLTAFGRLFARRRFIHAALATQEDGPGPRGPIRVLRILAEHPETTNADLAEMLDIRPSSVSALVGRLEEAELVERETDTEDKRKSVIKLTDKGRALIDERVGERTHFEETLFAALSLDEQKTLTELLNKLGDDFAQHKDSEHGHGPWMHRGPGGGHHDFGRDFDRYVPFKKRYKNPRF